MLREKSGQSPSNPIKICVGGKWVAELKNLNLELEKEYQIALQGARFETLTKQGRRGVRLKYEEGIALRDVKTMKTWNGFKGSSLSPSLVFNVMSNNTSVFNPWRPRSLPAHQDSWFAKDALSNPNPQKPRVSTVTVARSDSKSSKPTPASTTTPSTSKTNPKQPAAHKSSTRPVPISPPNALAASLASTDESAPFDPMALFTDTLFQSRLKEKYGQSDIPLSSQEGTSFSLSAKGEPEARKSDERSIQEDGNPKRLKISVVPTPGGPSSTPKSAVPSRLKDPNGNSPSPDKKRVSRCLDLKCSRSNEWVF